MKLRLYSLAQAPRALPNWQMILEDLGGPRPAEIALVLGVGVRTVFRWNQTGQAPRSAQLALFWLTRWGRSEIDCRAFNDCQMAMAYAGALERRVAELESSLGRVLAVAEFGAANQPTRQEVPYVSGH